MKKVFLILILIGMPLTSLAEEVYVVVVGTCRLEYTQRDQYGQMTPVIQVNPYIAYPYKIDPEKYTNPIITSAYTNQLKKKHNGFQILGVKMETFEKKEDAKKRYKELQKEDKRVKLNLKRTELEKIRKRIEKIKAE